jgi:hypothetical protein
LLFSFVGCKKNHFPWIGKRKSEAAFTEGLYQGRRPQAGVHLTLDRRRINATILKPGERKSLKKLS